MDLFNKYEAMNENGIELSKTIDKIIQESIKPIVKDYVKNGCSYRDIESIIVSDISVFFAYHRLKDGLEARIKEDEQKIK